MCLVSSGTGSRPSGDCTSSMACIPRAANVSNDGPALLPLPRPLLEVFAQFIGATQQILAINVVPPRRGTGERIASERAAEAGIRPLATGNCGPKATHRRVIWQLRECQAQCHSTRWRTSCCCPKPLCTSSAMNSTPHAVTNLISSFDDLRWNYKAALAQYWFVSRSNVLRMRPRA